MVKSLKSFSKKLLICLLIILTLNNFFIGNLSSYAGNAVEDKMAEKLGTVVGLLTWPVRIIAIALAAVVDILTAAVAYSQGGVDKSGKFTDETKAIITPFDILFNKVALVDINFFNFPGDDSMIDKIRMSIAGWYYILRTIAAAILLVILIYVGIRMAISTIATDRALYKKMLVDWVVSLALIFLLQYIIIFTVNVNSIFVKALAEANDGTKFSNAVNDIALESFGIGINAIGATVVYCMIVAQTVALLFTYMNRMLKIAFLIIIAPLITLTYAIDKMGDGKAQALGNWMREFIFTIILQPFHCIIYMAFVSMAFELLTGDGAMGGNLASAVVAVLCLKFTKDAESLVKSIFGIKADKSTSLAGGLALSAAALSHSKSIGQSARKGVNGAKNLAAKGKSRIHDANVDRLALAAMRADKKSGDNKKEDGSEKSFADYRQDAQAQLDDKQANKIHKKYKVDKQSAEYKSALENKTNEVLQSNPGLSRAQATSRARLQLAQETRATQRKADFENFHPKIARAVGRVNSVKKAIGSTETFKNIKNDMKTAVAGGMGVAAGAMLFGSGQKFDASLMAGAATAKGASQFFATSTNTMTTNGADILKSVGKGNPSAGRQFMHEAMIEGNSGELDTALKDLVKDLEKQIEAELGKQGKTPAEAKSQAKSTAKGISTHMQRSLKADPSMSVATAFSRAADAHGINTANNADLSSVGDDLGTVIQKKNMYEGMMNAAQLGVDPDVFMDQTADKLGGLGSIDYEPTEKEKEKAREFDFKESVKEQENEVKALAKHHDQESQAEAEKISREIFAEIDKKAEEIKAEKAELESRIAEIEKAAQTASPEDRAALSSQFADIEQRSRELEKKTDTANKLMERYEKNASDLSMQTKNDLEQAKNELEKKLSETKTGLQDMRKPSQTIQRLNFNG